MKRVLVAAVLLATFLAAPAAAQTWIMVDRDAVRELLHSGRRQARRLQRLAEGDRELVTLAGRLRGVLRRLARRVRRAPLAPLGVTQAPPTAPAALPGAIAGYPAATTPAPPPPVPTGPQAMTPADFKRLVGTIGAEPFPREKLGILRQAARANHFTVGQVRRLLKLFTFDSRRLSALAALAPRLVDPEKAFALPGDFTFSSSKRKAREVLARVAR